MFSRFTVLVTVLAALPTGLPSLAADDTPAPQLVLKLGIKIGETRQKIAALSETVEATAEPKRKREFADLKRRSEEILSGAEKSIASTEKIADALVALGGLDKDLHPVHWSASPLSALKTDQPAQPAPPMPAVSPELAQLLGVQPVVTITLEDYIAFQTFAPLLQAAAKNPAGVNQAVEALRKKYPQGLGKYIQETQMEAVREATRRWNERNAERAREQERPK